MKALQNHGQQFKEGEAAATALPAPRNARAGYGRAVIALCCVLLLAAAGCSGSGTEPEGGGGNESLAYSVYAGEAAGGSWATFAFTKDDEGKDVVYYFPDNAASYFGEYRYNSGDKSGEIPEITAAPRNQADGPPCPAPGAFTISPDEKTITFGAYTGGGPQTFPRRRGRGGDRSADDPPPSNLTPLTSGESLNGTVWAATAYRTRDWTTLAVTAQSAAAGTITVSHSFDCTSFPRDYSNYAYNAESTLSYIGPFTVSTKAGGDKFTFLDFYGHGGTITLNRMR
jgi:hypothetical protein